MTFRGDFIASLKKALPISFHEKLHLKASRILALDLPQKYASPIDETVSLTSTKSFTSIKKGALKPPLLILKQREGSFSFPFLKARSLYFLLSLLRHLFAK